MDRLPVTEPSAVGECIDGLLGQAHIILEEQRVGAGLIPRFHFKIIIRKKDR